MNLNIWKGKACTLWGTGGTRSHFAACLLHEAFDAIPSSDAIFWAFSRFGIFGSRVYDIL